MILPVDHPERILAVIPVTDVVPTLVRQEPLRIIMVLMAEGLSADLPVIVVKTVHPAADLIQDLTQELLNVVLVTIVLIPAVREPKVRPAAVPDMNPIVLDRPNAVLPAIVVGNIHTPTPAQAVINPAHADQATQLPAPDQNHVLAVELPVLVINAPKIALAIPVIIITTITTTIIPVLKEEKYTLNQQTISGATTQNPTSVQAQNLIQLFKTFMNGAIAAAESMNMTEAWLAGTKAVLVMRHLQNAVLMQNLPA